MALQVLRLVARNTRSGAALRVSNIRAATTPIGTARLLVSRLVGSSPVVIPVRAGTNRGQLEPVQQVTLTGSGAVQGVWRQIAGPPVALQQSGTSATYTTPLGLFGAYLEFEYVVQGQAAQVAHTVLPATERAVVNGVEIPLIGLLPVGN